ncbi:MAG: TIGR03960 family B12-binding radical SAM protein [Thermodesulfobacteriota bacterium]
MRSDSIYSILPMVRKPSSYLGNEINSIKKDPTGVDLFVALCFPDLYEIGTSHFGLQILYHLLNRNKRIAAERVFSPAPDMEARLRASGLSAFSMESRRPLEKFDIIGFSLLYELNYTNVLTLLSLSGIPFYASQRGPEHPLVIAGGPCAFNPEPVADFFDAMVIGDGEEAVETMSRYWLEAKQAGALMDRAALLDRWSTIRGVYVPSLFKTAFDPNDRQLLAPVKKDYACVTRAVIPRLTEADFPDTPVVPYGKPVHDRLRLEIARGCTKGCRFCQAGMIYRPVRERSADELLTMARRALDATGYEELSLLSLSTGDYSRLQYLLERLITAHGQQNMAVSVPSFRAGSLSHQEMGLIQAVRKTGFTIAPEAGTQRLRDVINKNITEEEIVQTVSDAFGLGWNLIKAYFMVGLPTETEADLEGIVSLVRRLSRIKGAGGRGTKIHVSVATFIPKAHTPFQWEPQIPVEQARDRIFMLKQRLESGKIGFKWQNPETSLLEGLFARGDRRLSALIEAAWRKGCRFDGWSDSFNFTAWRQSAEEIGLDIGRYTTRKRSVDEPLPWDHVVAGVTKAFLEKERINAGLAILTPDCRTQACSGCGVCDFKTLEPLLSPEPGVVPTEPARNGLSRGSTQDPQVSLELVYSKTEDARFFGHLEFIGILTRAIRRAKISMVFSHGFHPKPRISFSDPLPVGLESEGERLWITVSGPVEPASLLEKLNRQMPGGIVFHECRVAGPKKERALAGTGPVVYRVSMNEDVFCQECVDRWREERVSGENARPDALPGIDIAVLDSRTVLLKIGEAGKKQPSVYKLISDVFGVDEAVVLQGRVVKQAAL